MHGQLMATHERTAVEDVEHEYSSPATVALAMSISDSPSSYESLPPNFSLSANMVAGAFAGIAVRRRAQNVVTCID